MSTKRFGFWPGRSFTVRVDGASIELAGQYGQERARVPLAALSAATAVSEGRYPYRYARVRLIGQGAELGGARALGPMMGTSRPALACADYINALIAASRVDSRTAQAEATP